MTRFSSSASTMGRGELDRLIRRLRDKGGEGPRRPRGGIPRRGPGAGPAPLSPGQEQLWFLYRLAPQSAAYNLTAAIRFDGLPDRGVLARVLAEVLRRHDALRTVVGMDGEDRPVQRILPLARCRPDADVDLRGLPAQAAAAESGRIASVLARTPFDLERGPLFRAAFLLRPGRNPGGGALLDLIVSVHHLVADGWSVGLFTRELAALYRAFAAGEDSRLEAPALLYGDFAAWQRDRLTAGELDESVAWWRERLAGAPALELPADRPRPAEPTGEGAWVPFGLDEVATEAVRLLAHQGGTTPFTVLVAAFQLLLARWSGEDDVVVGSVVAGRERPELAGLVGYAANTLALRTATAGAASFRELLERTRESVLGALRHQEVPFATVVEKVAGGSARAAENPLFRTVVAMEDRLGGALELRGPGVAHRGAVEEVHSGTAKFDLSLLLQGSGGAIDGVVEFSTDLFDRTTVVRAVGHLRTILAAAGARPDAPLDEVSWLTVPERHQVLEWNPVPTGPGDLPTPVHLRFEERARRTPDSVALASGDRMLSYGALDRWSGELARILRGEGVRPEILVGLCVERSPEMVVGILAVLKAGGAYLPLDPAVPEERLRFMLEDGGAPVVLVEPGVERNLPALAEPGIRVIPLTSPPPGHAAAPGERTVEGASADGSSSSDHLAYVIYTSGSTGRPKGSSITHANVGRLLDATEAWFEPGPGDTWTLFHSFAFDFSVWELWGALAYGGRLEVVPYWISRSPDSFRRLLRERRVTVLNQTPSAFKQLVAAEVGEPAPSPGALRCVVFGGEALEPAALEPWFALYGDARPRLVNMYGITETTVHVTYRPVAAQDLEGRGAASPVGRPIPDLRVHLLDPDLDPVPLGVPGEIHVGGPGLARGYLGRPALTAERFVPDPFTAAQGAGGERLYKAGDLARRLPTGELDFLGRIDQQVKIRGFRIELGEIEAVLARHAAVEQVAVVARDDARGDRRLAAYVVPRAGAEARFDELRSHCAGLLPEYMVPVAWTALDSLPLTPNGKLDRRALPAPAARAEGAEGEHVTPRGPVESAVAEVFAEVFGLERVGAGDDFFALGGHSMLATQVVSRLRRALGVEPPLRLLFENPVVRDLARALEEVSPERRADPVAAASGSRDRDTAPASHAQRRLWFLDRLQPGSSLYNVAGALGLRGELSTRALAAALRWVVARHESLRTTLVEEDGIPVQVIARPGRVALPVVDLSGLARERREEASLALARGQATQPFDLERGPLLRLLLVRREGRHHVLSVVLHHIVSDAWSLGVFVREVGAAYEAFRAGRQAPSLPPPVQYSEHARAQEERLGAGELDRQLAFWRSTLDGVPPLELSTDRPRPATKGAEGGVVRTVLPSEVAAAVHRLARTEGLSPFMVLVAVVQALLWRDTGQDDFGLGTPIANRNRLESEGLVGFLVNTLVLRADLAGRPTVRELLRRVRSSTLEAFHHQDLPFERLVEELAPERDPSRTPLFQVMFAHQNAPFGPPSLPGVEAERLDVDPGTAKFDLLFEIEEDGGAGLALTAVYDRALFDRTTVERWVGRFQRLARRLPADLDRPVDGLSWLPDAERHQVLAEWSASPVTRPPERGAAACIQEAIRHWAGERPDAVAVEEPGAVLTYGALMQGAWRLARELRARGVGPDTPVGVFMTRSAEAVLAWLGVIEAGGVFLPLDPTYPGERIELMLADARPPLVLTSPGLAGRIEGLRGAAEGGPEVLVVGRETVAARFAEVPAPSPPPPDGGAYVIYTSGSSGVPKGVVVPHATAALHFASMARVFDLGLDDGALLFASMSFDLAVEEVFAPLTAGARICVWGDREFSGAELSRFVVDLRVTYSTMPTAAWAEWVRELDAAPGDLEGHSLRCMSLGGEAMPPEAARRILELVEGVSLINVYGPTEAVVSASLERIALPDLAGSRVPIGRSAGRERLHVADRNLRPAGVGVPGELLIGGPTLARGYLGRPARTAEVFVPDPFGGAGAAPGSRLYRTGDLVRWLSAGKVDFLRRIDRQVKVRGVRVELGEVEAALTGCPGVAESAVIASGGVGQVRLVAFVVPDGPEGDPEALRRELAGRLPAALVPSAVSSLDRLPRTPGGKIDRKTLQALADEVLTGAGGASEPPRTPTEEMVARVYADVLGLPSVGARDGFFDLGGHSLLATRAVSRLRAATGVEVPVRVLFESPTVEGLARHLDTLGVSGWAGTGAATPPPIPSLDPEVRRAGRLPLSFAQERLWFLDRYDGGGSGYNVPGAAWMEGAVDPRALERALQGIVRRHEVLRTTFHEGPDGPTQTVARRRPVPLTRIDLTGLPRALRRDEALERARQEARRPFDLARGPLLRTALFRLARDRHLLTVDFHHIVSDGWSIGVFLRELAALYGEAAGLPGVGASLPELTLQYADFAAWQRRWLDGEVLDRLLDHWRARLEGLQGLDLPTDRPRPPEMDPAGDLAVVRLPGRLAGGVEDLARRSGTTSFMVLLAAVQALLARLSGQDDVAVGSPIANRTRPEIEPLIGFFVNSLVLRGDLAGGPSFRELLDRTRRSALDAYAHQDLPFERLVGELAPERDPGRTPLFQVMVALQQPDSAVELPGVDLEPVELHTGVSKFDLTLVFQELSGGPDGAALRLALEYRTSLFDRTTVERLAERLERLLAAAVTEPGTRLAELPLLSLLEREQILGEWSGREVPYPREECIPELVRRHARERPDAVAVEDVSRRISYRELVARGAALASALRRAGIRPGDAVGLLLGRSAETVTAMLGVLETGACYVPLDPDHPEERLRFVLEDTGAPVVLATAQTSIHLPQALAGAVRVLDVAEGIAGGAPPVPASPAPIDPRLPANVLYTSGSTGRPKGVVLPHRGVARLVRGGETLDVGPDDVQSHLSNTAFDASTLEVWGALLSGARLVVVPREEVLDPEGLVEHLLERRVSSVFLTTALFNRAVRAAPARLGRFRNVLFGGEAADPSAVARALDGGGPGRLVNLYGPTENTVVSTWQPLLRAAGAGTGEEGTPGVPIGGPVDNSRAYVLDRDLRPVPVGVPGELVVGGDGLALGYLGRPALTAEAFVPDPFPGGAASAAGDRLYRTGDLVRRLPDGAIDFLGRVDDQVKIRGHRIEPGEVETVLAAHPAVDQVVVVVREDRDRDPRLVAYAVAPGGSVDGADLRSFLKERLPGFLVPSAVVLVERIPLTPNGKVDRRALPAPEPEAPTGGVAPRDPVEELLAGAFREVLGLAEVGVHDSFFDLGGHSLDATRLVARLHEAIGIEVPVRVLFEEPTVAGLAARVAQDRDGVSEAAPPPLRPLPPERRAAGVPLSFSQERLWILEQVEPGTAAFAMPFALRLRGPLDAPSLARATAAVVVRHEALRTAFRRTPEGPRQLVRPAGGHSLPVADLSALPPEAAARGLETLLRHLDGVPFDLAGGSLLRTVLVRESAAQHVLHASVHHIASDGWSIQVLLQELAASYHALRGGRDPGLPALPVQYGDFAVWQRRWLEGPERERLVGYWRERLAGVAEGGSELPTDRPRPAVQTFRGGRAGATLDADLTGGLERLARRCRASRFMVLLAAFKLVMARLSGEWDVVVGSPIAGRRRPEVQGLVGMFLNHLVLRTDLSGEPSFSDLVGRVRETALGAYAHQELPFEALLEELQPARDLSRTPLFQVFFNMFELDVQAVEFPGLDREVLESPEPPSKFDLTLYVSTPGDGVRIEAVYNADLFDGSTIERVLAQYRAVLARVAADPELPVSAYRLGSPQTERELPDPGRRLAPTWRGSVPGALRRVALEGPDRIAVVGPEGTWSYRALDEWSARVAARLRALGVARGDRVAIYGQRCPSLVAAVHGVLRAGAAFVMLDPVYPARRIAESVAAAGARVLVRLESAGDLSDELDALLRAVEGCSRLTVGRRPADLSPAPEGAASRPEEPGPEDLAYVAFTSGSTGRPKGILGRHGPLTHFLPWQCRRFGLGPEDRFTMLSGLAHDPLQRDLFTPAWLGAALVVPAPELLAVPGRLRSWLAAERATVSHLTPALAQVLTERPRSGREGSVVLRTDGLRRVFLVGDVLSRRDVDRLRRLAPGVTCVNLYGSTETQRAVGFYEVPPEGRAGRSDREVLPLGRGMEGAQLLVLTGAGALAAVGEVGEIGVRSPHLAGGYLDRPGLSAERFTPDPFGGAAGGRVYRTGDLGRYGPDGFVRFLGRADQQVKIRGFRIELGEVSGALNRVEGVREAAVLLRTDGALGRRLTAYVVPEAGSGLTAQSVRAELARRLPAYMVPATCVLLERLPLTPNRKLDRKALLELDDRPREGPVTRQTPSNDTERKIAGIVQEVLGLAEVGVEENFFDLGGNSLLLVQVHERLQETFGREIPMVDLFTRPTIRSLAAHLGGEARVPSKGDASRDRGRELRRGRDRLKRRRRKAG